MKTTFTKEQKAAIARMTQARKREQNKPEARVFPKYFPGMTAADYIRRYNALNCGGYQKRVTLEFITETIISESSTYDPALPLVIEESI